VARALPDFKSTTLLVLGDVMLDRCIRGEVRRISPEAPVPVVRIREKYEVPGGAGNVGNNLAKLGCRAVLLGIVGDDAVPVFVDPKGMEWERYRSATCITPNSAELEPEATRVANTAAGIVVGKLGTQPVTAAELQYGLIVGLNSDSSVKRLKGPRRPILPESDRLVLLKALSCVDMVIIFDEDTPLRLIEALRPDVLVKGSDYRPEQVVGRDIVESYGGRVALVSLMDGYSTTRIAEKLST
jgi:rfaE bifunctional protein nucleotidyltransferase chain/domain